MTAGVVLRCLGCADGITTTEHHCAGAAELLPYGGSCACPRPTCGPHGAPIGRPRTRRSQRRPGP